MVNFFEVFWPAIVGAMAVVIGALVAGSLSSRVKISEFRQAWINDLRRDIADYMVAARKWHRLYEETKTLTTPESRDIANRENLLPACDDALVILWRIKLRFNPKENRFKKDDDAFLQNMSDLLDSAKFPPPQEDISWDKLASVTIKQAQEILKREWEVTKGLWATFANTSPNEQNVRTAELLLRENNTKKHSSEGFLFRFAVAFGFGSMVIAVALHSSVEPSIIFVVGVTAVMALGLIASLWFSPREG